MRDVLNRLRCSNIERYSSINLRFHRPDAGISRTNRIYDATKTFGNIVTFQDLERSTIDAITLFGDKNTKNVVLEKLCRVYGRLTDAATGEAKRGFMAVVAELEQRFPDPAGIESEKEKKDFSQTCLVNTCVPRNILQNYDEFATLKACNKSS